MKKYIKMTFEERQKIEEYLNKNFTIIKIAELLNRAPISISREIRRTCDHRFKYNAVEAHKSAQLNRSFPKMKILTPEEKEKILKYREEGKTLKFIAEELKLQYAAISVFLTESYTRGGSSIEERVSNLEQQMEIVLDLITKERNNG